jgi:hypothetical protein
LLPLFHPTRHGEEFSQLVRGRSQQACCRWIVALSEWINPYLLC